MKAKRILIILAVMLAVQCVCTATIYEVPRARGYFNPFRGSWEMKKTFADRGNRLVTVRTSCSIVRSVDTFRIHRSYQDGQKVFMTERVSIMNMSEGDCYAVFYQGKSEKSFLGKVDMKSKVLVMKSVNLDSKKTEYLVIDFTPCPQNPPVFKVTDKK